MPLWFQIIFKMLILLLSVGLHVSYNLDAPINVLFVDLLLVKFLQKGIMGMVQYIVKNP